MAFTSRPPEHRTLWAHWCIAAQSLGGSRFIASGDAGEVRLIKNLFNRLASMVTSGCRNASNLDRRALHVAAKTLFDDHHAWRLGRILHGESPPSVERTRQQTCSAQMPSVLRCGRVGRTRRLGGVSFFSGQLFCCRKRISCRNLHVGLHAGAFPIGVGDGIDGASEGHTDAEMLGDPMAADGMRAASAGFAD